MPGVRKPNSGIRFLLLPVLLGLWAGLILARLIHLQVFQSGTFLLRARRQQERTVEVSPVRGVLYDRNLRPLAISVEVESVFAVPAEIRNSEGTARLLSPVLDLEEEEIRRRLEGSRYFSWVKRKVSARQAARVRQLRLQGIYFQKETKRFYPKRELAAHVLGHVGMDDQGLAGVELSYDQLIRGRSGQLLIERDARQRWFRRTGRPTQPGQNLVLTLDENIQFIVEQELAAAVRRSRARSGTALVLDPHTGEILAMASRPTFNPNTYAEADPEDRRNPAVSEAYEPGSTFKVVTLAAALEEGLTVPSERIDCQMGSIVLAGHTIRDHKAFGILNVGEILKYSSGVGAIKLALRVGNEGLYRYVRSFGFGSRTGIELPGEAGGLTKPPERWSKISIGAIAMGQEIGVTPLQLAVMASTIANGGWWVQPRIVQGTEGAENKPGSLPGNRRRILSPETAEILQRMMVQVVEAGTGKAAHPEGYTAAGKTGTAQKIDPSTGAYSSRDYVASFVGFVPADSPLFTILVILDSPRGKYHGGDVAAPIFRRIAEPVLAYRNVPASNLDSMLRARNAIPKPEPAWPVSPSDFNPTALMTLTSETLVPNFLGKAVRAVTEQALAEDLDVALIGSGVAHEQWPLPGSPLPVGEKVRVWFRLGSETRISVSPPSQPANRLPGMLPAPSVAGRPLPATG